MEFRPRVMGTDSERGGAGLMSRPLAQGRHVWAGVYIWCIEMGWGEFVFLAHTKGKAVTGWGNMMSVYTEAR